MLHHFSLHVCGRDQLWTVTLSPLHVRDPRRHQSWLRLVYVLCVGRPGLDASRWLPLYSGPFIVPPPDPCGTQAQAGEWLRVTGAAQPVLSWDNKDVLRRDSSQRQRALQKQHRTSALSHSHDEKEWHLSEEDCTSSGASLAPTLWVNCSVLLPALQEENSYFLFFC